MIARSNIPALVLGLGFCFGAAACNNEEPVPAPNTQPSVQIEANPDVDLSSYSSFDVIDPKVSATSSVPPKFDEFQAQIVDAVVAELTAKGLTQDSESPQLEVNPYIRVVDIANPQSFYDGYWGWYYGYQYAWTVDVDYQEGTLLLDVVDRGDPNDTGDDVLVYRGAALGLLGEDAEVVDLQIRNAVHAIFADWPESAPPIDQ